MYILDMPAEIFDLIIDLTLPHGIENFALSCKAVYERAQSQIDLHTSLKKWKSTTNADGPRHADTLDIVFQISQQPLIGQYIESLHLWDHRLVPEIRELSSIDYDKFDCRTDDGAMARIKDLFARSELFKDDDLEKLWESVTQEGGTNDEIHEGELYVAMLLLTLLPNLKILQLPEEWYQIRKDEAGEALVPLAESLVRLSNAQQLTWKGLGHLETLIPFAEEGWETKIGLQCLQPFMLLDSIRNLFAVSCVANNSDWQAIPFDWPDLSIQSPLTRIELAYCCVDAPGLASFLAHTPALKILRISHQTKWGEVGHDWNPGECLETIANFCGHQLTELAITIDGIAGEVANGLSSFLRLPKLEKLEVDIKSFCGPPLESGQRLGRNAIIPPEGTKAWVHDDIPCIGSMLPVTIREVHVNATHPGDLVDALKALFKNIKHHRGDRLLSLHTVIIRQWGEGIWEQSVADDYGITLEVFDSPGRYPQSIMPRWKREFDTIVGGIVWEDES